MMSMTKRQARDKIPELKATIIEIKGDLLKVKNKTVVSVLNGLLGDREALLQRYIKHANTE